MKEKQGFNNLKEGDKKQVMSLMLVICLVGVVLLGTSYAWLSVTQNSDRNIGITAGTLNLAFEDNESDTITLVDSTPISDVEGLNSTAYNFKVTNTGNIPSNYVIYMDDVDLSNGEARLDDKYVKYSIIKNDGGVESNFLSATTAGENNARQLANSTLEEGESDTYSLRIWLDENNFNASAAGKTLKKSLRIEASQ